MTDSNQQSALSKEQIDSVVALYSNGQYQEAINQIKVLNESHPNTPFLFNLIGACYKAIGQLKGAAKMFETAVSIKPEYAEAHKNLGITLRDLGQMDEALKSLNMAISAEPNYVDAHYNLAETLKEMGRLDDAVQSYKATIVANPSFYDAYNNLGVTLMDLARFDEAIPFFKKALDIKSDNIYACSNLGGALNSLGKLEEAIKCYEYAIELEPNFTQPYISLGDIFRRLKQPEKALPYYELAYQIKPSSDFVFGSLLNIKMHLGMWDGFLNHLKNLTIKIGNNEKVVGPFNLLALIDDPALQRKANEIFVNTHYFQNIVLPVIDFYPKHPKIRIGYFSADFREHPVGFLTAGLYELHNRDSFEVHAFSFGPDTNDKVNLRIKSGVDHFRDVRAMSHKEIVLLSRSLEIDIAVDLGGISGNSRPRIFAMSAAPIQLSYIGFLGTMGADYYDYLIADSVMIPKENQKHYAEKIVYLPSFQVNDSKDLPPEITLTRKDVGLPEEGFVFCCFNNTYKFTPTVFDSWARILEQVEGSVLMVFANNELSKANLTKEIELRGIDSSRLIFGERYERAEYLARYRVADLFLDTHPFNAGTTASDTLKMELPLLTMKGKSFNSREAASILTSINLPELITNTPEEYEALAIELATNPGKLKAIKDKLKVNLSTAPLYDTKLFAKNIESAYTQIYKRHHEGLDPDHIYV